MIRPLLSSLALAILAVASTVAQSDIRRVSRQHANETPADLKWLVNRFNPTAAQARQVISERHAAEDLDQLEWLLENRYAYFKLKPVDYRGMLDAIRAGVGRDIRRGDLAIQLQRVLSRFGDGHAGVNINDLEHALGGDCFPFLAIDTAEGLVATRPDRAGFLDDSRPILKSIDGVAVEKWIEAAARLAPDGSPQLKRHRTLRLLRFARFLRSELGLPAGRTARIELGSPRDAATAMLDLTLMPEKPTVGPWPRGKTRRLDGDIGYIRLERMDDDPRTMQDIAGALRSFRDTRGLVLDIRGDGGGGRAPIRVLHAFLAGNRASPRVYNLVRLRLEPVPVKQPPDGRLADRFLFPEDWRGWTPPHREAIQRQLATFKPVWTPPDEGLSAWHALVLPMPESPEQPPNQRPFVVLMNEECFSSSDVLLSVLKGQPNVTLMGAASGGGSGRPERFELKNSRIGIDLSSMVSFQPDGSLIDHVGIQPDVPLPVRITDVVGRTDSQLDAACALILKK